MMESNRVMAIYDELEWKLVAAQEADAAFAKSRSTEDLHLAGGVTKKTTANFGQWYCSRFTGESFIIRLDSFFVEHAVLCSIPVEEKFCMITPLQGCPTFQSVDKMLPLSVDQFECFYTAGNDLRYTMNAGNHYQIISIACDAGFLQPYAAHCHALAAFIEKATAGQQFLRLLDNQQFLSMDCKSIIKKITRYNQPSAIADLYFTSLLQELLTLLCIRIELLAAQPSFPVSDLQAAQQARQIIESDLEVSFTIAALTGKTRTSEYRLQQAFKYLYGQTIGKFCQEAKLEKGYTLLETTTYPLRVICEMVGYPDPSNFSAAFKKHYGCRPGKVQKNAALCKQ